MKILFLSDSLKNGGGMERMATTLANNLAEIGWDVDFMVSDSSAESFFPLHPSIVIHSYPRSLRKFLRRGGYDRLVNVGVALARKSLPACLGLKTKVVTWEHFSLRVGSRSGYYWRRLSALFSWKTIVLTEKDKNDYPGRGERKKIVVISNYTLMSLHARAAHYEKEVLAVGRLTPMKGFDKLLDAWALVAPLAPDWKLRIVGSGAEETRLKERARALHLFPGVIFTPSTKDVGAYYRRAGLYALSSSSESFGLVLLEAKTYGLPCVSFDCPNGPAAIVRDSVDGFLVENGNVTVLADTMLKLMEDEELNRRFGKAAQEDVLARFDQKVILAQWMRILA